MPQRPNRCLVPHCLHLFEHHCHVQVDSPGGNMIAEEWITPDQLTPSSPAASRPTARTTRSSRRSSAATVTTIRPSTAARRGSARRPVEVGVGITTGPALLPRPLALVLVAPPARLVRVGMWALGAGVCQVPEGVGGLLGWRLCWVEWLGSWLWRCEGGGNLRDGHISIP